MPKTEKNKFNIKERVEDSLCDLSLLNLKEVPVREISLFKRVTILDLSSNQLVTLNKNFTTLTRLVKLDLSKNQIKFLPEDFGLLENLRHLDLYDNRLEHIPLSFAKLKRLRYLDLKGNPLTVAWEKIVGRCLTTKDCQDAARNTVNVCAKLELDVIEKQKLGIMTQQQNQAQLQYDLVQNVESDSATDATGANNVSKKSSMKKAKSKQKKPTSASNNDKGIAIKQVAGTNQQQQVVKQGSNTVKAANTLTKRKSSGCIKTEATERGTALKTIILFLILCVINLIVIYMIMFKNPEIAEKIVEYIPPQYRNWILTKTEIFRLRISDWILNFRTKPEEH